MSYSSEESSDEETQERSVIKIILLGQSGCGKTSIVMRWIDNSFTENTATTIGAAFYLKNLMIDEKMISIRLWDTSGQERFKSLAPLYYREAAGVILVLDIQDPLSFEKLEYWMNELRTNCNSLPIIGLAANKYDLFTDQQQQQEIFEKATKFAKNINAQIFQTSAKTGEGVEEIFEYVAKSVVQKHSSHLRFKKNNKTGQSRLVVGKTAQKQVKKEGGCC
ncbi:ras family-domain-containing protein [Anaeramoeba flamelloides]|uniref:Ras family-domain-containing protein n=1 Tax=Anaeramoeba flamelloides TaxID=1746091 RepID=A0AAV8A1L9_9EUKA|nr:ras family-domain-containing protein [Anaeramoeba flamelloides]KAJ6234393.1 ras family-domain-containing protein [Anaeramoeba flamelloides]